MKKNILIATIISVIALGVFGYNFWINSPQYSLLQIQKSIENKDRFLFDKYVDTNGITEDIIVVLTKIFIEGMEEEESSEYSFFDPQIIASGLVSLFKPYIEDSITEIFDIYWEQEIETFENQEKNSDFKNYLASFQLDNVKKDGKIAKIELERVSVEYGEIQKIEFKLNKKDNYWRITKILNLEEILIQYAEEIEEWLEIDA